MVGKKKRPKLVRRNGTLGSFSKKGKKENPAVRQGKRNQETNWRGRGEGEDITKPLTCQRRGEKGRGTPAQTAGGGAGDSGKRLLWSVLRDREEGKIVASGPRRKRKGESKKCQPSHWRPRTSTKAAEPNITTDKKGEQRLCTKRGESKARFERKKERSAGSLF